MPFAYSNNGQSFRTIEQGWPLAAGEVLFDSFPSSSQLSQSFPQYMAAVMSATWTNISAERDARMAQGGYQVGGHWFHSDQQSRSQQLGLVLLGANIPANVQWKTMDGSFVPMTQQLAQQILAAAAASDQAIFAAAETHRTAMEASADPANYDFSAGWPPGFGG